MTDNDYVLRPRDDEELDRLDLQHRVWREQTAAVVELAGFGRGDQVLDIGCGPGFLSLDLAELVGPPGSVIAVDSSEHFIDHLNRERENRGLSWIQPELADIRVLELEPESLDGAICRWVLMFVDEPERVVAGVARALRPGGVFAVMEYVQFRSISLWPEGESFGRLYDAVHRLIASRGGDPDIGGRVPALLAQAGFEIVELLPVLRIGRPGSPLWEWLEATNANHPDLVEAGLLDRAELDDYYREWAASSTVPGAFFAAPPVLATVARKPTPFGVDRRERS